MLVLLHMLRICWFLVDSGKERMLFDILHDCHLPQTVQFRRDRTVTVGDTSVNSNTIPNIELLQIFDEVHLLANSIKDGKMCTTDVINVPLFLTQLRLSIITGTKKRSPGHWRSFQEHLQRASSYVEYDQQYGNPNMLEYDPSAVHTSTATYTYVAPRRYTNIISLAQRLVIHRVPEQHNVNQTLRQSESTHDEHRGQTAQHHQQSTQDGYYTTLIKQECDQAYEEIQNISNPMVTPPSQTNFNTDRQPKLTAGSHKVLPQTPDCPATKESNVRHSENTKPIYMTSSVHENIAPALPHRIVNRSTPKTHGDVSRHSSNDAPITMIQPTVHDKQRGPESKETSGQAISDHVKFTSVTKVSNTQEVSKLTIEEVVAYLNKLGLGQYEETFRDQKIDGALLVELDKDMLRDDLGMKSIEALKITKFVKDGHVPL